MMALPPTYEPTPSPGTNSLGVDQQTNQWPSAYLPNYSTLPLLRWWEEAALEVLRTSHDFDDIKHIIKFTPGLDTAIAASVLSNRRKGWLDAFWTLLSQDEAVNKASCDSLLSTAKASVAIITRRSPSPARRCNLDWMLSQLRDSPNILTIAEQFDAEIQSIFCAFTFEEWIEWLHGYQNNALSHFLDTIFNFRNELVQFARQYPPMMDGLLSLQESLVSKQPLPLWIVSTAISSDTSSCPSEALQSLFDPIYQLFKEESSGILPLVRKLSILQTRFESQVVHKTDANWPKPFSNDFVFWKSIEENSPEHLAKLNTKFVCCLYFDVSPRDLLCHSEHIKEIGRLWSDLVDDIFACLSTDGKLTSYFMDFAEHLLLLLNVHSAAAIGLALYRYGFQPRKSSQMWVWNIINPKDNFAGCRKFMVEKACLPLIFPFLVDIQRPGNSPDTLVTILSMLGRYFGERKEVKVRQSAVVGEKTDREGTMLNKYSLCYALRLHFSWSGVQQVQNNINPRDHGDKTRPSCSLCKNAVDKAINVNRDQSFVRKELYLKPLSAEEFHIALREQYAIELWALEVQENYLIFMGALRQIETMLLGIADSLIIGLEILSGLDRTQMVMLSCATEVDFSFLENYSIYGFWTEKKQDDFRCTFTCSVPGLWHTGEIFDRWDKLLKDLLDEIRLKESLPAPSYVAVVKTQKLVGSEKELKETLRQCDLIESI